MFKKTDHLQHEKKLKIKTICQIIMGTKTEGVTDTVTSLQLLEKNQDKAKTKKKLLVTSGLTLSGIAARALLQHLPSVSPIIAIAAATGYFYDTKYGFSSGTTGYIASNFLVWGGQGPWTIFQALGAGLAGITGGSIGKITQSKTGYFTSMIIGTILFEISVNVGGILFVPYATASLLTYFLASLPYGFVHLISTLSFGSMIYGFKQNFR
ncbi:MAG: hypothetical protein ABEI78_01100 [Candidatus Nanohaloarchaea archaeon]